MTRAAPRRTSPPNGNGATMTCAAAEKARNASLGRDQDRQFLDALHEAGADALRLADDLDHREPLQNLLPDHPQLHLGQAVADAAVDSEAERQVLAGAFAVDDECVRVLDRLLVAVARDVPHDDLLALA